MSSNFIKKLKNQLTLKFADVFALIIAVMALLISVKQGRTQTSIDLANSSPYLQFSFNEVDMETVKGIKISNLGSGPAKVISYHYYINYNEYKNSIKHKQWLPSIEESLQYYFEYINNIPQDFIIGSRDNSYEMFLLGTTAKSVVEREKIEDSVNNFYNSHTKEALKELIIVVEYQSLNKLDKNIYYSRYSINNDSLVVSRQLLVE